MTRFTTVEFPVFCDYIVHVEVASDIKKSMSKYKHTKDLNDVVDGSTRGITIHNGSDPLSFIFLKPNASVSEIAHKSWHAIRQLLRYVGVELDSETVAYHLGYLTQKVFDFVRNKS